jgi:hypothetical protein
MRLYKNETSIPAGRREQRPHPSFFTKFYPIGHRLFT